MNVFLNANMFARYLLGFWFQVVPVAFICLLPFDREDYRLPPKDWYHWGLPAWRFFHSQRLRCWSGMRPCLQEIMPLRQRIIWSVL